VTQRRKLIEVALPLEAINREAARENYIYKGNPSAVHKWWAQRPFATARAVLFSQLVDDPACRPEATGIEDPAARAAWVSAERARLFRLIEKLVVWENSTDEELLQQASCEILQSTDGHPPSILDPFAGAGTIPLEAQRLGLRARGSDLNPVAVLITKSLIEIPGKFANKPPSFPGAASSQLTQWRLAQGLSEDVRRYGDWMNEEAKRRIGNLYPRLSLPRGQQVEPIAWIWSRTVTCPNPACGIAMPLMRSRWLSQKKGRSVYAQIHVRDDGIFFDTSSDPNGEPTKTTDGTVGRSGASCVKCGAAVDLKYIRGEGQAGRLGTRLVATVADGPSGRFYTKPDATQEQAAAVEPPSDLPSGDIPAQAPSFRVQAYGFTRYTDLFTNRQLAALTTFSDLVNEARVRALSDALANGMDEGGSLHEGGTGALAYADAVATYLAFAVDKLADYGCSFAVWYAKEDRPKNLFARQSLPMVWDYPEVNPFASMGGGFSACVRIVSESIGQLGIGPAGTAVQEDAQAAAATTSIISTDPPYYDNIGYSDLSDFFYVWLRRSLREVHPGLLSTVLVPKAEELVANPYRHGDKRKARDFFESGFQEVFKRARESARNDFPMTVYYAFKQSESDAVGESSSGWETLLDGMVRGGWQITGTWPMRSERGGRMISVDTNALASCIVLALRPRPTDADVIDRRTFTSELRASLPTKLRELQQGSIAPVDIPQATIGPGMGIFSRYSRVVEANGAPMSVRSALQVINQVRDEVLSAQEGDFDSGTRWCLKWFESHGFDAGPYGEAETLASAFNTSVAGLDRSGVLSSRGGKVQLFDTTTLTLGYDPRADDHITLWEVVVHLAKALDEQGLDAAGLLMARAAARVDLDAAKELAYLLFSIAEKRRWSDVAQLFNMLAASWADVLDAARRTPDGAGEQLALDTAY
jgi:putative DNA methylase